MKDNFGSLLTICLSASDKTRRQIADVLELDVSLLCHWIKGTRKPKGFALVNLCETLEIEEQLRDLLYKSRSPAAWQTMAQKSRADRVEALESAYKLAALL